MNEHDEVAPRVGRRRYAVLLALLLFATLAATPQILAALHLRTDAGPPTSIRGVTLLPAPSAPPRVALPAVATPIDPGQPHTTLPAVSAVRQAAAVAAEDSRIRFLVHHAARVFQPEVLPTRGALPTLLLTAGSRPYTYADLVQYGALVLLPHHAGLLLDNVFVGSNARLVLGAPELHALYLDSSPSGFTSIVAWGGNLAFQGTGQQPLTIMGWDRAANSPAKDAGSGRSYIREVGGRMTLTNVRVSALGFWSGRTGGVAWTGATALPSTGGATGSTFTDETYGAFVTRGKDVTFRDDLFEFNELDGLHIHRNSAGTSVNGSSASRNGGNGFLVDRATNGTTLRRDVSEDNARDGFLLDGRPLVTGASASGGSIAADTGTYLEDSAALGNARTGIEVEGGLGTVLRGNEICASVTGIAVREGATQTILTGNDIRCHPRVALELGPGAPQATVSGNTLVGARVGMLIRSSGPVEADSNRIVGATVFGITARGDTSSVSGQDNVISGAGFRAVDARADASSPALAHTQDSGWAHRVTTTFWSYLIFHPLAIIWLSILALVAGGEIWSRIRRMPAHPYPASTRWRPAAAASQPLAGDDIRSENEWLAPERELVATFDGPQAAERVSRPGPPDQPYRRRRPSGPYRPAGPHPLDAGRLPGPERGPGGLHTAEGTQRAGGAHRSFVLPSQASGQHAAGRPEASHNPPPPDASAARGWFTPPSIPWQDPEPAPSLSAAMSASASLDDHADHADATNPLPRLEDGP